MSFNSKKNFKNISGTSVISPELLRDDSVATDTLNIDLYDNFGLTSRRGEEGIESFSSGNARGVFTTSSGEKLILTSQLRRVVEQNLSFNVTSGSDFLVEIYQENEENKELRVFENGVFVYSRNLGTTLTDVSLAVLINGVNINVPGLVLSVPDDTQPAYGLAVAKLNLDFNNSAEVIHEYTEVVTGPNFGGAAANAPLYSMVERNGVIYFTTNNNLYKYDGTSYYPASLPKPFGAGDYTASLDPTASSSPADGIYRYRIVWEYTDAQGNPIRSTPSDEFGIATNGTNRPAILISGGNVSTDIPGVTATILRTKEINSGGGSIFFVVASGIAFGSTFFDTVDDAALTEDYVLPPFEMNASNNARYMDIWRGLLGFNGVYLESQIKFYMRILNILKVFLKVILS